MLFQWESVSNLLDWLTSWSREIHQRQTESSDRQPCGVHCVTTDPKVLWKQLLSTQPGHPLCVCGFISTASANDDLGMLAECSQASADRQLLSHHMIKTTHNSWARSKPLNATICDVCWCLVLDGHKHKILEHITKSEITDCTTNGIWTLLANSAWPSHRNNHHGKF